ncbi:MAG: putative DCC family thiol-disulfide oxidoreductase YuxK [Saprospiraceae bacterium]|jgi:predicted DCC family thiol-disulfide oxidoreductase YuxK
MEKQSSPIVLFDGVCNLCNGAVKFAIKRDKKAVLHFASLQSDLAGELMRKHNIEEHQLKTFIFIEKDKAYTRSTAGLKLVKSFGGVWSLLYAFIIIPKPIRDAVYNLISNNRYRWFGKQESCMIPTPEIRARFLG